MTTAEHELIQFRSESFSHKKIPYAYLIDSETIETKSGHLIQVIKLDGLFAELMEDQQIDQEKHLRNTLLKSVTDSSYALYFHTIRKKHSKLLQATYDTEFAQKLHNKWHEKFHKKEFYVNEYYITLVKKPPVGKIRRFSDLFHMLSSAFNREAREIYRKKSKNELNKVSNRILSHLVGYQARKLASTHHLADPAINHTELLSFLGELINLEPRMKIVANKDLAYCLSYKRLFFDNVSGTIATRGIDNTHQYAAILSIKEYDKVSCAGLFDHLLDIDSEMIITQSFSFLDRAIAKKTIEETKRNTIQSDDGSVTQTLKIDATLDDISSGASSSGEHHFTILCKSHSIEELDKILSKVDAALNEVGIIAVREDVGLKPAFFAMLPGNQAYIARKAIISSTNMASFASLHNYPCGQYSGNYWGDAVTQFETISGTAFYFNFHQLDVGNTVIIGAMGSGKTVVESFLLTQSMKFGGKLIIFDLDRSLEVLTYALGGKYSIMHAGTQTGFAPLQMDPNKENRLFLIRLLEKLLTIDGYILNDDDKYRVTSAIDGAFALPKEERILRNIAAFLGPKKTGSIRNKLDQWIDNGAYAWVFDNDADYFDLGSSIIGFDMTSILNDPVVCNPIYFYLFHQVDKAMDGSKMRIVVAEGWKTLSDDEFSEKLKEWSSTPRKKEAFLLIDTQSPEDISRSPAGRKIISESVTQLYFANPTANYDTYVKIFGLSIKEFNVIKNLDKKSRYFLIKQGKQSVIAKADLNGFDEELIILSTRMKYTKILDEVRKRVGEDPNKWMKPYIDEVKKLERL